MSDTPNLTARLASVSDHHTVVLRDFTGAPVVPKLYGSTSVVVARAAFTYVRTDAGDWRLFEVKVNGWRARKDGSASDLGAAERFGPREAPGWLIALAQRYEPFSHRTARHRPGEPGGDRDVALVDLDAEVSP